LEWSDKAEPESLLEAMDFMIRDHGRLYHDDYFQLLLAALLEKSPGMAIDLMTDRAHDASYQRFFHVMVQQMEVRSVSQLKSLLESMPAANREHQRNTLLQQLAKHNPQAAFTYVIESGLAPGGSNDYLLTHIFQMWASRDVEAAMAAIQQVRAPSSKIAAWSGLSHYYLTRGPSAYLEWLQGIESPSLRHQILQQTHFQNSGLSLGEMKQLLSQMPPGSQRMGILQGVAQGFGREAPAAALEWALQLESRKEREAAVSHVILGSLESNLDFALEAIGAEGLGADTIPDFLCISFSSTDYVGHQFGVNSKEVQDTYLRLDQDLQRLLEYLDREVGAGEYTVFLTSDHGAGHVPAYLKDLKAPAGYQDTGGRMQQFREFLQYRYGNTDLVRAISNNQVYLDGQVLQGLDLPSREVQ
jgi:hypothetical protein